MHAVYIRYFELIECFTKFRMKMFIRVQRHIQLRNSNDTCISSSWNQQYREWQLSFVHIRFHSSHTTWYSFFNYEITNDNIDESSLFEFDTSLVWSKIKHKNEIMSLEISAAVGHELRMSERFWIISCYIFRNIYARLKGSGNEISCNRLSDNFWLQ